MNTRIYPRDERKEALDPADRNTLRTRIISAREEGKTKAQAVGGVLNGSHDLAGFDEVWDAIESERKALAAISPAAYDTEAEYNSALTRASTSLDPAKWAAGMLAANGVDTFEDLKAKLTVDV